MSLDIRKNVPEGTGVGEWATYGINTCRRCKNNCLYCYAHAIAYVMGQMKEFEWKDMIVKPAMVQKGYRKRNGRIMFPTSHDIVNSLPEVKGACLTVLGKLLKAGNTVLLTTKAHPDVVEEICDRFKDYKAKLQFRITITTLDEGLREFWETDAPTIAQRLRALEIAYENGFPTSTSDEPFLSNPVVVVEKVYELCTESVWIGPANPKYWWFIKKQCEKIGELARYEKMVLPYTKENLQRIYGATKDEYQVKIRYKDHFQEILTGISRKRTKKKSKKRKQKKSKTLLDFDVSERLFL